MDDRRVRVTLLVVGLTLSAGTLFALIATRRKVIVCYRPVTTNSVDGVSDSSMKGSDSAPKPLEREAEPLLGGTDPEWVEAPVPVSVQLVSSLERLGPVEYPTGERGELEMFQSVDWSQRDSGQIQLTLGLTHGYGGPTVKVLLDTRARTARATGWCGRDFGPPFEIGWKNVRGVVKLVDWSLTPTSFVEVDLQGELDNQTYQVHLCHDLNP